MYFAYIFTFGGLKGDEKKRVVVIAVLFVAAAIFWAAFEQAPTSLNLFAKDFTDRQWGSFEVPGTVVSVDKLVLYYHFCSGLCMALALARKAKYQYFQSVQICAWTRTRGYRIFDNDLSVEHARCGRRALKVSGIWLTLSYLFQTFGELSLSPVGLSSMTKLSPRRYVGQMMGIWFLATSLGNIIAGLVGGSVDPEKLEQTPMLFKWTTIGFVRVGSDTRDARHPDLPDDAERRGRETAGNRRSR